MDQLFCPLRCEYVAAQPEEHVRQRLLRLMIQTLGYPRGHLAVEKALRHFPHLASQGASVPDRRVDIVCFGKGVHKMHALYPLLLVECKAVKLNSKVLQQVAGYNHFAGAPFVAVANVDEIHTGWYDPTKGQYCFVDFLPSYEDLLSKMA